MTPSQPDGGLSICAHRMRTILDHFDPVFRTNRQQRIHIAQVSPHMA